MPLRRVGQLGAVSKFPRREAVQKMTPFVRPTPAYSLQTRSFTWKERWIRNIPSSTSTIDIENTELLEQETSQVLRSLEKLRVAERVRGQASNRQKLGTSRRGFGEGRPCYISNDFVTASSVKVVVLPIIQFAEPSRMPSTYLFI